jgi:hypothetical protein
MCELYRYPLSQIWLYLTSDFHIILYFVNFGEIFKIVSLEKSYIDFMEYMYFI